LQFGRHGRLSIAAIQPASPDFRPWSLWTLGSDMRISPEVVYWTSPQTSQQSSAAPSPSALVIAIQIPTRSRFPLEGVAGAMWLLIAAGNDRAAVVSQISSDYQIAKDVAETDVDEFVNDLVKTGLLELRASRETN